MATLKKPKTTRVKRDYPEFRDRLRDVLERRDVTQTKAAEMVGMDIRTFNHVVAGPTHPDLMLIKDIGAKFKVNLNYLFGLSSRVDPSPQDFDYTGYAILDRWDISEGTKTPSHCASHAVEKKVCDRYEDIYLVSVSNSECDVMQVANIVGWFEKAVEVSSKGVYHVEINGRSYFRWMKRNEWGGMVVSSDVLLSDSYEVKSDEVTIMGRMVRKTSDF